MPSLTVTRRAPGCGVAASRTRADHPGPRSTRSRASPACNRRAARAARARAASQGQTTTSQAVSSYVAHYEDIVVETVGPSGGVAKHAKPGGIALYDITPQVRSILDKTGVKEGVVNVVSRHTTTALTINECEPRLMDDVRQFLAKLVPASYPYLHNDMQFRDIPVPFKGVWPDNEPINAHSHIIGMLLGQSDSVPIHEGKLVLGTYQSIIFVELDGPRTRKVGCQILGLD